MSRHEQKVKVGARRFLGGCEQAVPAFVARSRGAFVAAAFASACVLLSVGGPSTVSAAGLPRPTGLVGPPGLVIKPPPGPPVGPVKQPAGPAFPGLCPLQPLPLSVTVCWYDRSTDEQRFVVYRRDQGGIWQAVYQTPTRNTAGVGDDYSYLDTDLSVSGQCYMIAAVNAVGSGATQEECTVRPDPSRFPQTVPQAVKQWYGLSNVNDGTGDLWNGARHLSLTHANQTFGVDLDWSEHTALWKIEAQGGPHLMEGQAVALRVWGGGWLRYGNETWGVDLVLSSTPSYEWYVLAGQPGTPIGNGEFALWNSAAKRYLVSADQTWGVSLDWYKSGGSFGTVHQASVTMTAQPPVQGYVPFLGYFGGGPGNTSVLTKVSNSPYGFTLFFVKPGHGSQDCGNPNDVITLAPGATMTSAQMQTLWGSATPSLAQRLPFLACAATQYSSVSVNVEYRDQ